MLNQYITSKNTDSRINCINQIFSEINERDKMNS